MRVLHAGTRFTPEHVQLGDGGHSLSPGALDAKLAGGIEEPVVCSVSGC